MKRSTSDQTGHQGRSRPRLHAVDLPRGQKIVSPAVTSTDQIESLSSGPSRPVFEHSRAHGDNHLDEENSMVSLCSDQIDMSSIVFVFCERRSISLARPHHIYFGAHGTVRCENGRFLVRASPKHTRIRSAFFCSGDGTFAFIALGGMSDFIRSLAMLIRFPALVSFHLWKGQHQMHFDSCIVIFLRNLLLTYWLYLHVTRMGLFN